MRNELIPCPFCGGEAFMQAPNMHHKTCTVCKNCGISTAWGTPAEAIAAWNRRTPSVVVRCGDCCWFQDEVCCCADSDWCADFPPEDCSCKFGKIREDRP